MRTFLSFTCLVLGSLIMITAGAAPGPITLRALAGDRVPPASSPTCGAPARAWPQSVGEIVATPVFADLDRDGTHEIVVGDNWDTYVFSSTGAPWPGWPIRTSGWMEHAAIADIDGDDVTEILFSCTVMPALLRVYTPDGQPKPGWPVSIPVISCANITCPLVVDLDGDDALDVGVAAEKGVYFFHADGTPLAGWPYEWPVPNSNSQWSAPAVGDLDGDGSPEVVVGTVNFGAYRVYVIRADGTAMPGWPKATQPIYSSPALADLDGDADLEIIVQEGDVASPGNRLWVWHHTGQVLPGWPRTIAAEGYSSRSNPAVVDVDGDGNLEIVTGTADGMIHVLRADGTDYPGYPRDIGDSIISSPSVIDVDEDGVMEIFLTYWLSFDQYVSGWHLDGTVLAGFPREIYSNSELQAHASQHVLDLEGDGDLDLVTAGTTIFHGLLWVFEIEGSSYNPVASPADWPKIRRDMANTGCYPTPDPAGIAAQDPAGRQRLPLVLDCWPNPLTTWADIRYELPAARHASLTILDPQGRRVAMLVDGVQSAGLHAVAWDRRAVAAGVYLCRLEAGGASARCKVIVR